MLDQFNLQSHGARNGSKDVRQKPNTILLYKPKEPKWAFHNIHDYLPCLEEENTREHEVWRKVYWIVKM